MKYEMVWMQRMRKVTYGRDLADMAEKVKTLRGEFTDEEFKLLSVTQVVPPLPKEEDEQATVKEVG